LFDLRASFRALTEKFGPTGIANFTWVPPQDPYYFDYYVSVLFTIGSLNQVANMERVVDYLQTENNEDVFAADAMGMILAGAFFVVTTILSKIFNF